MSFTTTKELRGLMLDGVQNADHQRLILNAVDFAEGIIAKIGPRDYGLVREDSVDTGAVGRAIARFVGRDVLWTTTVSVPPDSKRPAAFWWADSDAYNETFFTAFQGRTVLPFTAAAASSCMGTAGAIVRLLSNLGYHANFSVNGVANGLVWGKNASQPGYHIWYDTIFPVLKALCLSATFNQPREADRVIRLATVMREVLPLGEKKSQEYSWVVLAAPNP